MSGSICKHLSERRRSTAQIAQTMVGLAQADDVVVPTGNRRHVRHILVRESAEMLKRQLVFDMDIPYLLNIRRFRPRTVGRKIHFTGFGRRADHLAGGH